jgi:hypothetical protein
MTKKMNDRLDELCNTMEWLNQFGRIDRFEIQILVYQTRQTKSQNLVIKSIYQ